MTRIVTSTYRYKRPPRRKKAAAQAVPQIVTVSRKRGHKVAAPAAETDAAESKPEVKSSIVTVRKRGRRFADVPDMTPEEHQRRGDLAGARWREMARRVTDKDQS